MSGRSDQPVSIRHHRFDPDVAHGYLRFDNGWLITTCARQGEAFAPDEYELLPAGSPITCITCLVKGR